MLVPRRELLEVKRLTLPTLLASAAVLVSTERDGRTRPGTVARRLSGVSIARSQRRAHAAYWEALGVEAAAGDGPLWVVCGDSSAQGIGVADPAAGYVGQVRTVLSGRDGTPWRLLNLSSTGALTEDVLADQVPMLCRAGPPTLVSCGVGANDILRTPPRRLRRQFEQLAAALPTGAVVLTLPPGLRGIGGSYLRWLNAGIRAAADRHGHRVADVETRFRPPWRNKFCSDGFHPSAVGYADWAEAVLATLETQPAYGPAGQA